jgi:hypothetical protein
MTFQEFERRAQEMFDSIPDELKAGIEFVAVSEEAVPHPELPEVFTLGECATGEYDLGYEIPEPYRSGVHLYHGSFAQVAARDEDFDWEGELWETLVHEIRHHREWLAGEDALEDFDYAADENFKRRDGQPFDPLFYRSGEPAGSDRWSVDDDLFVERVLTPAEFAAADAFPLVLDDLEISVPRPDALGDVHFLYVDGTDAVRGDLALVLVRRRTAWEELKGLFGHPDPQVLETTVPAEDDGADGDPAAGASGEG